MQKLSWYEWITVVGITLIWLSHGIGIFTPEVGFDAVWYHLPVINAIVSAGRLVYVPELYQSVNPLLSDLLFGMGYVVAGEFGTKIVAYLFGVALCVATYVLAKKIVTREWALLTVLVVSSFQVVAWQTSSFYVDVAKAMWELCALSLLCWFYRSKRQKFLLFSALFFGASLATKLFSLLLLPVFLMLVYMLSDTKKGKHVLLFLCFSLLLPLPFYVFSAFHTGTPFYSFTQHLGKIGEIGQESSLFLHVWQRTLQLPHVWSAILFSRDYTSIVIPIFTPLLIWYIGSVVKNKELLVLMIWSAAQLALWWYLPPLSSRYALSGFITLVQVLLWCAQRFSATHAKTPIYATIFLAVMINMIPRIWVNYRSLQYILGKQTKEDYIRQFLDGHIDQHLLKWHQRS